MLPPSGPCEPSAKPDRGSQPWHDVLLSSTLLLWNMHGHGLSDRCLCTAQTYVAVHKAGEFIGKIRGLNEWAQLPTKGEDLRTKTMILGESLSWLR